MKTLLIDDDQEDFELFRDALLALVPSAGCIWASSCQKGIELLERDEAPDLIFIDGIMPIVNGPECITKIRKNEKYQNTKIILYSTMVGWDQQTREATKGIAFLKKTGTLSELQNALQVLLSSLDIMK